MRIKKGITAHRKHKKIRSQTKGMTRSNRSSYRRGKQATIKALQFSYRDRRNKTRTLRSIWNIRINAAAKLNDTTYSKLIAAMKTSKINLNRKVLSELAVNEPTSFKSIVDKVKISK